MTALEKLLAAQRQSEAKLRDALHDFEESVFSVVGSEREPHLVADVSFKDHTIACECGWGLSADDALAELFRNHRSFAASRKAPHAREATA